ncbi:MAG: hypothetical protein AAF458_21110 [Pseudomonadota bacterium]
MREVVERVVVASLFLAACLLFTHDFLLRSGALVDVSFGQWAADFLSGDWGFSRRTGLPVLANIAARVPLSLSMLTLALLQMAVLLGAAHLLRFWMRDPARPDRAGIADVCAEIACALPAFAAAVLVALVFSEWLGWFPAVVLFPPADDPRAWLSAIALPSMTLALATWGFLWTRRPRDLTTSKDRRGPVLETIAVALGGLLIVEVTYALPGVGYWFLFALRFNDQPVLVGVSLPLLALAAGAWCVLATTRNTFDIDRESPAPAAAPHVLARQFMHLAWLPVAWLSLLLFGALAGSALGLPGPDEIDVSRLHSGPEPGHWLGTDALGRDMLARMLAGVLPPVLMAIAAAVITVVAGVAIAFTHVSSASSVGRWLDTGVSLLASLPLVLTAVCGAYFAGSGVTGMLVALCLARLRMGLELGRSFIATMRGRRTSGATGAGARIGGVRVAQALVHCLVAAIVIEGTLGFLGLVPAFAFSWGDAIRSGREHLAYAPQMSLIPVVMVVATLWSCQRLNTALDALAALWTHPGRRDETGDRG